MSILHDLAQENAKRREREAAEEAEAQDVAWRIANPEAAKKQDAEAQAFRERLEKAGVAFTEDTDGDD